MDGRIQQIESYVIQSMETVTAPDLRIAHDFKHVDPVRGWALRIVLGTCTQRRRNSLAVHWLRL